MEIPYKQINQETLLRLVSEFVTRDGTDYGEIETSLEAKVQDVLHQLKVGKAVITYDQETQTCNIV